MRPTYRCNLTPLEDELRECVPIHRIYERRAELVHAVDFFRLILNIFREYRRESAAKLSVYIRERRFRDYDKRLLFLRSFYSKI